jgi:hypothetical protein
MRKESFLLPPGFEVDVGLGITEITTTAGAISRQDKIAFEYILLVKM